MSRVLVVIQLFQLFRQIIGGCHVVLLREFLRAGGDILEAEGSGLCRHRQGGSEAEQQGTQATRQQAVRIQAQEILGHV